MGRFLRGLAILHEFPANVCHWSRDAKTPTDVLVLAVCSLTRMSLGVMTSLRCFDRRSDDRDEAQTIMSHFWNLVASTWGRMIR